MRDAALAQVGAAVYEYSGAKDVVANCISDFELLGCAKGAVEVGSWFVSVGAAADGAEIAADAGAHFLEGAATSAEGRSLVAEGA
ncbi:hypothetical protein AB0878_36330 [Amycolatopsis sp. NPDC047767]|uniref:hypothetical protein n=1 Tax=Amycolatopsis sp. NPDC047767 TaxID=3156765 RepID=UPI003456829A